MSDEEEVEPVSNGEVKQQPAVKLNAGTAAVSLQASADTWRSHVRLRPDSAAELALAVAEGIISSANMSANT